MVYKIVISLRMVQTLPFFLALQVVLERGISCEIAHAGRFVNLDSLAIWWLAMICIGKA